MKNYILFILALCWVSLLSFSVLGQTPITDFEEEVINRFQLQQQYYPQEKAYLHFDRNHYIAGDTVWFRGYLVNAMSHRPDTASRYLYVDLVNPLDSVVLQVKTIRRDGTYAGYLTLPDDMAEGTYTVWAYTMYMQNTGKDYFFQAPLRISDPLSAKVRMEAEFTRSAGDHRFSVNFHFKDFLRDTVTTAQSLKAGVGVWPEGTIRAGKDGVYSLSQRLPANAGRNVLLVEYDKYKRYVEIPAAPDQFDVTFHPEGGHLIPGVVTTVGFKSLAANGLSEDITGRLTDETGTVLAEFESFHNGMGTFSFMAEASKRYYVECTNSHGFSKQFELPAAQSDAVGLRLLPYRDRLTATVLSPAGGVDHPNLWLAVQNRGIVHAILPVEKNSFTFLMSAFPAGINHFILLDEDWNILSERLHFNIGDGSERAQVHFTTNKQAYGYRERTRTNIRLTDEEGNPLTGNFSVSVTDDRDILPDSTRNIWTDLLLSSELRGYVESPAWYFESNDPSAEYALDALMLTQGWRRYDVPKVLAGEYERPQEPLEISQVITGRVKSLFGSKSSVGTPVHLFVPKTKFFQDVETDEEGRFIFGGFNFPDSTTYFVNALSRRGNDRVELLLDEMDFNPSLSSLPGAILPGFSLASIAHDIQSYIAKADQKWQIEHGIRTIHLDAVTVTSSQGQNANRPLGIYEGLGNDSFGPKFFEENFITSLDQVLMRVAGVMVDGEAIIIRGPSSGGAASGQPLFVIDDMVIQEGFDWQNDIDFRNVEKVEVIKGANAAIFGMSGGNGAIVIYYKKGAAPASKQVAFNQKLLNPLGYQLPAEFYAPKYETAARRNSNRPDLRTTLYWNPVIRTDEKGNASFDFYTSDGSGTTYSVVIEGVTDEGRIIRSVEKIIRE